MKMYIQGSKLLGDGNPNLGAGFPTGNPCIVREMKTWVFRLETPKKCLGNPNSVAGFLNGNSNIIPNVYP